MWRARLFLITNTIACFVSFSGGSRGYFKLLLLLRVLLLGGVHGYFFNYYYPCDFFRVVCAVLN